MKMLIPQFTFLLFLNLNLVAVEPLAIRSFKKILNNAPAPEVPVLVVKWIKEAPLEERQVVTSEAVRAALETNPGSASLLVGAVSRALPDMAAVVAATAVTKQPADLEVIIKAAVAVAPAMAGKIVARVCKAAPEQYRTVAVAAWEAAPISGRDILRSVALSIPDLRERLEQEIASYGLVSPPVAYILDRVQGTATNAGDSRPDQHSDQTPDLVPGSTSPGQVPVPAPAGTKTNGSQHGKHGGRNYAKP